MKTTFTFLLLFISLQISFANNFMCASSGLTFLPEKKEISLNSLFIIEGYAMSQKTINSFKKRKIFLVDKTGETVDLILLKIHKGNMALTQAVFKTKNQLKPNTKYYLKFSNQTKEEKREVYKWNSKTSKREKVFWKTSGEEKLPPLKSDIKIKFRKTEVIQYGCGPSANAIFETTNKNDPEVWYKTEVIDLSTKTKTAYILRKWRNQLNVGHGMCSGAFTFESKGKYKVRFTPMNTDGKMNKATRWVTFKNPHLNQKGFGF